MGQVFGITGAKEPAFTVVWQNPPFEVRSYDPYFVAEVPLSQSTAAATDGKKADNSAFMTLAGYIGVFGEPKNQVST